MSAAATHRGLACAVCRGRWSRADLPTAPPDCPACGTPNALRAVRFRKKPRLRTEAPAPIAPVVVANDATAPSAVPHACDDEDDDRDDRDDEEAFDLADVAPTHWVKFSSGVWALDRALDGGLAKAAVIMIAGDKGVGKTRLTTRVVGRHLQGKRGGRRVFVGSAEEPPGRLAARLDAFGFAVPRGRLRGTRSRSIEVALDAAFDLRPTLALFDSLPLFRSDDLDGGGFLAHAPTVLRKIQRFSENTGCCSIVVHRLNQDARSLAGGAAPAYDVDAIAKMERVYLGTRPPTKTPFVRVSMDKNRLGVEERVGYLRKGPGGLVSVNRPAFLNKSRR